jgi:hypothetical protein
MIDGRQAKVTPIAGVVTSGAGIVGIVSLFLFNGCPTYLPFILAAYGLPFIIAGLWARASSSSSNIVQTKGQYGPLFSSGASTWFPGMVWADKYKNDGDTRNGLILREPLL